MLTMPSSLRLLVLASLAGNALSSRISFSSDEACEDFEYDVQGPNGYPDGECSLLDSKGSYGSFKVARLDQGCDGIMTAHARFLGVG